MRSRKIILVVPPSPYHSLDGWEGVENAPLEGASIAATVLSCAGYDVDYFDFRCSPTIVDSVIGGISSEDAVCLAGSPDGYVFIKEFAQNVKHCHADVPVILGGPLATISWHTVLLTTRVDFCVLGECERTLPELMSSLSTWRDPMGIPVAFRTKDGTVSPGAAWTPADMDGVPCPDYWLWASNTGGRFPAVVCYSTQRGCRESCTFCANPWNCTWRAASRQKIKNDLCRLKEQGMTEVWLNDPTFNTRMDHSRDTTQTLSELNIPWSCSIRAKEASYELFRAMRDGGCRAAFLGVESADDELLARHNKGICVSDTEACLDAARRAELHVVGFLLLGLPGETGISLGKTLDFVRRNWFVPRARFAVPYPGTRLFDMYVKAHLDRFPSAEALESYVLEMMSTRLLDTVDGPWLMPDVGVTADQLRVAMKTIEDIAAQRLSSTEEKP